MKIVAVIPARWQSTRLKGKVLVKIKGKPMVQHVWERLKKAQEIDNWKRQARAEATCRS